MPFSLEVTLDEIYAAADWLEPAIGRLLAKRVLGWKAEVQLNPFLLQHYEGQYQIEFRLAEACEQRCLTRYLPIGDSYNLAYTFVVALHRIFEKLPNSNRANVLGRLRGALKDQFGFRPLAYEVSNAVHLAARGFDFEWLDGRGGNRFDLLARKNGCEIEIECKSTSVDTGRKVHHVALCRVAGGVIAELANLSSAGGAYLFDITVPERLDRSENQIKGVSSLLACSIRQRKDTADEFGAIKYLELHQKTEISGNLNEVSIRKHFDTLTGKTNYPIIYYKAGDASVFIIASSQSENSLANALDDQVQAALKQFSGVRPALVALQLVDISREGFEELLKAPNVLHRIARRAFGKMDCVDGIVFTSLPTSWDTLPDRPTQGQWPSMVLHNPIRKFASPEIREVF